jgi:hypothetical protein
MTLKEGIGIEINSVLINEDNIDEYKDYFFEAGNKKTSIQEQWDNRKEGTDIMIGYYTNVAIIKTDNGDGVCSHKFYTFYKGDYPDGQRCKLCGKQEWF